MRGATKKTLYIVVVYIFQSTRPMRGATCGLLRRYVGAVRYFNPRAPCGARLNQNNVRNFAAYFNPRAPCGARRFRRFCWRYGRPISIHAPHAGRDSSMLSTAATVERFQSTRPMRGATGTISPLFTFKYISTHAPHAGRDPEQQPPATGTGAISIHAPHAGRDLLLTQLCG